MLPFWTSDIAPALKSGQTVLVAAHGNSLRALVKHLDGISESEIAELNIPTAVPLVRVVCVCVYIYTCVYMCIEMVGHGVALCVADSFVYSNILSYCSSI